VACTARSAIDREESPSQDQGARQSVRALPESYGPVRRVNVLVDSGADGRTRTDDLLITKPIDEDPENQ